MNKGSCLFLTFCLPLELSSNASNFTRFTPFCMQRPAGRTCTRSPQGLRNEAAPARMTEKSGPLRFPVFLMPRQDCTCRSSLYIFKCVSFGVRFSSPNPRNRYKIANLSSRAPRAKRPGRTVRRRETAVSGPKSVRPKIY